MRDTIDMAREANLAKYGNGLREGVAAFINALKTFEALVRADEREAIYDLVMVGLGRVSRCHAGLLLFRMGGSACPGKQRTPTRHGALIAPIAHHHGLGLQRL